MPACTTAGLVRSQSPKWIATNRPLRVTVCFSANDAQEARAKLLPMLRAPISSRKTIGWLLLVGLLVLFASMSLGSSFAAHTTIQNTDHSAVQVQHSSSGQSHHSAPNHCSTPLKSGCCACLATQAPPPEAVALQPVFPPVPLHQNYISRLIGPAQPPPRSS